MSKQGMALLFVLLAATVFAVTHFALGLTRRPSAAEVPRTWEVSGVFAEACECNPPCPCWGEKEPTEHHCHNVQIYKIEKGRYGGTQLDGMVVVVVWVTPEGEIMDKSAGHSVLVAIYVDRSTNPLQRGAVEKIWRQSFLQGLKGAKGGLKVASFQTAAVGPERALVIIPGILTFDVRKGNARPMNSADPQIRNLRLARSVRYRYSDYGMTWNYPGKHAAFGAFHAQSSPPSGH